MQFPSAGTAKSVTRAAKPIRCVKDYTMWLWTVDIYRMLTTMQTKQTNEANRSASLS
jgi:hypothetical protein